MQVLSWKSVVSFMWDALSSKILLRWKFKNSKTFSVDAPQFDVTGLPGTSDSCLLILGNRYKLIRLHAILYWYVKSFKFLSVMQPLVLSPLKKWLLLSTSSDRFWFLKLTFCIHIHPSVTFGLLSNNLPCPRLLPSNLYQSFISQYSYHLREIL